MRIQFNRWYDEPRARPVMCIDWVMIYQGVHNLIKSSMLKPFLSVFRVPCTYYGQFYSPESIFPYPHSWQKLNWWHNDNNNSINHWNWNAQRQTKTPKSVLCFEKWGFYDKIIKKKSFGIHENNEILLQNCFGSRLLMDREAHKSGQRFNKTDKKPKKNTKVH